MRGMDAAHFAASFDALITWIPLHRDAVRTIREINPQIRIGLGLAVEAITAMLHADPILDALRDRLLPWTYAPPVDYYHQAPTAWPLKPHSMAVDFEHKPAEVLRAVTGFLERYIRPLELNLIFFDLMLRYRYWNNAPGAPDVTGDGYSDEWTAIADWTQAHIAPVWGHNSGVDGHRQPGPHRNRIEEHFYRLPKAERWVQAAAAGANELVLVRSGEWRDIAPKLDEIRAELEREAAAGDAWVVQARSGSAFGVWS
jgi:hypothetical protein